MLIRDAAWKLSPTMSLVTVQGQWVIEDPRRGCHRRLNTIPPWLSSLLATLTQRDDTSWSALIASAVGQGVPRDQADTCIRSLAKAHLIVPTGSQAPGRDASALRDHQWALASTRMDYADENAIAYDIALMYRYAESSPPPASCWEPEAGSDCIMLPHPLLDHGDRPLAEIGRLLFFTNAILDDACIGPLPRSRRIPPSHGASHPFDLTLLTAQPSGESSTHYGYDPAAHALVRLKGGTATPTSMERKADVLSVHAALGRVQWRYRTSSAYPTLFLDLGHLVEILFQVSEAQGWNVLEIPPDDEPVLDSGLPGLGPVFARFELSPCAQEGVQ